MSAPPIATLRLREQIASAPIRHLYRSSRGTLRSYRLSTRLWYPQEGHRKAGVLTNHQRVPGAGLPLLPDFGESTLTTRSTATYTMNVDGNDSFSHRSSARVSHKRGSDSVGADSVSRTRPRQSHPDPDDEPDPIDSRHVIRTTSTESSQDGFQTAVQPILDQLEPAWKKQIALVEKHWQSRIKTSELQVIKERDELKLEVERLTKRCQDLERKAALAESASEAQKLEITRLGKRWGEAMTDTEAARKKAAEEAYGQAALKEVGVRQRQEIQGLKDLLANRRDEEGLNGREEQWKKGKQALQVELGKEKGKNMVLVAEVGRLQSQQEPRAGPSSEVKRERVA